MSLCEYEFSGLLDTKVNEGLSNGLSDMLRVSGDAIDDMTFMWSNLYIYFVFRMGFLSDAHRHRENKYFMR